MNKILAILFLLLAPLCVWAQSEDAETLYNEGLELLKAQKYEEAIPVFQKSLDLGQDDISIQMLSAYGLSKCYAGVDNYTEAIKYGTQLLDNIKLYFDESRLLYHMTLLNLAKYNEKLGNIQETIRLDTKALEICKKTLGEEHPDYANSLNNLAYYYSHIDKTEEAIRLCTQAMEIRKKILCENGRD